MKPKLIIVNGLPATGKTTLAQQISKLSGISSIGKDDIKELFFDRLGVKNREWSAILGASALETLYILAEQFLSSNRSIIIEAPFWPKFSRPRFEDIVKKNNAEVLEIYCLTNPEARHQRGLQRDASGNRHPGHSHRYLADDDSELLKKYAPMRLGDFIEVDTTNPLEINVQSILNKIQALS